MNTMRLSDLKGNEIATIATIKLAQADIRRLQELGIGVGSRIEFVSTTMFHDPLLYLVDETLLAIRRSDAICIVVEKENP